MAIANNARNVSYGKPKYGGVAYRAPIGTPLPESPDEPLDKAFENVGYLNEDGIGLSTDSSTASITDMGGLTVLTTVTSSSETYTLVMLETNQRAAKARFGDTNVESDELGNMTITHNGLPAEQSSWVFEILLTGNRADRIVIPSASVSEAAEINYNLSDAKGWGVTLAANADSRIDGGTAVEYIAALIDDFTILADGEEFDGVLKVGDEKRIGVGVQVEEGEVTVDDGFALKTSDPLVLSVDGTSITAAGEGRATLTVTIGGISRVIDVTVERYVPVSGVTVTPDTATVKNGESATLTATVAPENATDKTVTWSADDSGAKVTLTPSGTTCKVTGKADSGTVNVTCTTKDGSKTDTVTVTLAPKA